MKTHHRIAVMSGIGIGIGKELMPQGLRVFDTVAARFGISSDWCPKPWARCDWYLAHGEMMPADWKDQPMACDAIYFGAVGWPARVPDHGALWASLLKLRRKFDQYVSLQPCRLIPCIPSPLAGQQPGDNHSCVVRENTYRVYRERRHRGPEAPRRGGRPGGTGRGGSAWRLGEIALRDQPEVP